MKTKLTYITLLSIIAAGQIATPVVTIAETNSNNIKEIQAKKQSTIKAENMNQLSLYLRMN